MKPTVRNSLITLIAIVIVQELNAKYFNFMSYLQWRDSEPIPKFNSYYIGLLAAFLFFSIPEISVGLIVAKIFVGPFKIYWSWGLSALLFWHYQTSEWFSADTTFWGNIIEYIAYYFHPVSLGLAATILIKLASKHSRKPV